MTVMRAWIPCWASLWKSAARSGGAGRGRRNAARALPAGRKAAHLLRQLRLFMESHVKLKPVETNTAQVLYLAGVCQGVKRIFPPLWLRVLPLRPRCFRSSPRTSLKATRRSPRWTSAAASTAASAPSLAALWCHQGSGNPGRRQRLDS